MFLKDIFKKVFNSEPKPLPLTEIELFIDGITKSVYNGTYSSIDESIALSYKSSGIKKRYFEALIGGNQNKQKVLNALFHDAKSDEYQLLKQEIALSEELLQTEGLFYDRIKEFQLLYQNPIHELTTKTVLQDKIEEHDLSTDEGLHKALGDVAYLYFLRKMQLPTLNDIDRFQKVIENYFSGKPGLNILDYGCGSGDVSIYALRKGHKATICDVKGANLDFAVKRFDLRHMTPEIWESTPENALPFKENSQFYIINCLEVLEHLRNPFEFIDKAFDALVDNGVLILGSFPFNPTNDRGDHLTETVNRRVELEEYINKKFRKADFESENTFIKINH